MLKKDLEGERDWYKSFAKKISDLLGQTGTDRIKMLAVTEIVFSYKNQWPHWLLTKDEMTKAKKIEKAAND